MRIEAERHLTRWSKVPPWTEVMIPAREFMVDDAPLLMIGTGFDSERAHLIKSYFNQMYLKRLFGTASVGQPTVR